MASMPQSGNPNDMANIMSKQMMYFAPIMTVLFARSLPAALSLYWVTGTLVDWYQQHRGMKKFNSKSKDKTTVSVRSKKKEA
jgi:membrane protein insertase Oxa1/YidC/SpoIIIJ